MVAERANVSAYTDVSAYKSAAESLRGFRYGDSGFRYGVLVAERANVSAYAYVSAYESAAESLRGFRYGNSGFRYGVW